MNTKQKRLSPILSTLLIYIPGAIISVGVLFEHNIHGNLLHVAIAILYGLIISGTVITVIRIIKLVGKEWLSPIIAGLLILPLILSQFRW